MTISIHPPRVGWDSKQCPGGGSDADFNPPTPCGVGRYCPTDAVGGGYFNPPTPCGVGQMATGKPTRAAVFQSTHPVWGGTLHQFLHLDTAPISIHPPRVGWDICEPRMVKQLWYFNPPTPCGVGHKGGCRSDPPHPFQSTHPVWGGTGARRGRLRSASDFNPPTPCGVGRHCTASSSGAVNFNPPTPCGVGPQLRPKVKVTTSISIHPPRVGWDRSCSYKMTQYNIFQSTHPVWGGTKT